MKIIPKITICAGLLMLVFGGHTQQVNDGFNPSVNDSVRKLITMNSGHVLVGGVFTHVTQGKMQAYLAAFNNDGSLHNVFDPELNAAVNDMVQQPDGKILVAGEFTQINGLSSPYLARLLLDGTLDVSFNPVLSAAVSAVDLYPDGRIVVGGAFPGKLKRLHADGSVDNSFQTQLDASGWVYDLLVLNNNQMVVAGDFSVVNGMAKSNLVRLNQDGSVDTAFNPTGDPNWPVWSLVKQPQNQVVAGGEFTVIGGQNQTSLARFKSTGELDAAFAFDINGSVLTLSMESSGNLILGGSFTNIDGQSTVRVGRINSLGDPVVFASGYQPDASVSASTVLSDGDLVIGGDFLNVGMETRTRLARLHHLRGALDQDLLLSVSGGSVQTMASKPNGNYILAGTFSSINGQPTNNIIELSPNGDFVQNGQFASTNGSFINSVLVDGIDIYLGGDFTLVNGVPRQRLAKLFLNGDLDTSFDCAVNGTVYALAKWNNYILVAGSFSEINGIARENLAMISSQCSVIPNFDVSVTGGVIRSVLVQPDGKILLGGGFTAVQGLTRNHMARLLMVGEQGFPDSLNPSLDSSVTTMQYLSNRQIVIAGSFNLVMGQVRRGLALLENDGSLSSKLQLPLSSGDIVLSMVSLANGGIIVAGNFTEIDGVNKNRVAMIRPNLFSSGNYQVVNDFTVNANDVVRSLFPTQNGKVFLLGSFSNINNQARQNIARISQSSYAREVFNVSGNQVRWRQYGISTALTKPPVLDVRENGAQLITPQPMVYHNGYWQISIDSTVFSDTPIDFNLTGNFQAGLNNNSTAVRYVRIHQKDYSDLIFANGFNF